QHERLALGHVEMDVLEHADLAVLLADAADAGGRRTRGLLARDRAGGSRILGLRLVGHRASYSTSNQSRAKNSKLKMRKENSASTMAIALAASICPSLNLAKMYSGAVCVRSARLPETRIVEPNSPTERAKVSSAPDTMAPRS